MANSKLDLAWADLLAIGVARANAARALTGLSGELPELVSNLTRLDTALCRCALAYASLYARAHGHEDTYLVLQKLTQGL